MKVLVAALCLMAAQSAAAQYSRVSAMYSNRSYGDFSTDGFEVGYVHGFSLTESAPLFFQTGVKMDMGFKSVSESDIFDGVGVRADVKLTTMSFSVPLDLAFRARLGEGETYFTPYVGLNAKLNALANAKATAKAGGYEASDSESLFDAGMRRFQIGWHVGAGLDLNRFYIGLQYGTDFIAVAEGGNHTPTITVGVGYNF
ncbi:MAG: outer membrane beta-barrel protein [Muribaculaceae bacterium]|nr:outer membrane beta-barrel protein [Muribaculaceae bacterium]